MASKYSTLVAPPRNLKLPLQCLMVASFKPRMDTKPRNFVPVRCFSDQIENKGSSSSFVVGNGIVNPCHDIFSNINDDYDIFSNINDDLVPFQQYSKAGHERFKELLPLAWSHNPLTTLKLILSLRDHTERGNFLYRKASRESFKEIAFYTAANWLRKNHPKTLASNLALIVDGSFGSLDDLVKILNLLLEGQDVFSSAEMYERDPEYKLLHDRVSDRFVECLKSDIEKLKQQNLKQSDVDDDQYCREITKAADCCLSINSSVTDFLCESIARKIFQRESYKEGVEVEEGDYTKRVRERLKEEVLVPLGEAFNSASDYDSRTRWEEHDSVVEQYYEKVKGDKSKIAADALLPSKEITGYLNHWNFGEVAELQWKKMVEDMSKQGKMSNCLAICDINSFELEGGMHSKELAVGLTLLMSELSKEPWKGKVFSFRNALGDELRLIPFPSNELRHKWDFVTQRTMYWNSRIDFPMLFDLILQEAVNANLKPEQMIKKVFVFAASRHYFEYFQSNFWEYESESDTGDSSWEWETIYGEIHRTFKEKGYENAVPHLVFWNLSELDWKYSPRRWVMPSTKLGVTLLDGSSDHMVKFVLDNGGEISPDLVMEAAISGEGYQKLVLVD